MKPRFYDCTQKSGTKTFWKKCPPRKRTHISAAVYIIISLTALFLLILPRVLILLLACVVHRTEIDAQIPMQVVFLLGMYFHSILSVCYIYNAYQLMIYSTSFKCEPCIVL